MPQQQSTKTDTPTDDSSSAAVVCVNCAKETQRAAPENASANARCSDPYRQVDACMKAHQGQISACVKEWQVFRECHENEKK